MSFSKNDELDIGFSPTKCIIEQKSKKDLDEDKENNAQLDNRIVTRSSRIAQPQKRREAWNVN